MLFRLSLEELLTTSGVLRHLYMYTSLNPEIWLYRIRTFSAAWIRRMFNSSTRLQWVLIKHLIYSVSKIIRILKLCTFFYITYVLSFYLNADDTEQMNISNIFVIYLIWLFYGNDYVSYKSASGIFL